MVVLVLVVIVIVEPVDKCYSTTIRQLVLRPKKNELHSHFRIAPTATSGSVERLNRNLIIITTKVSLGCNSIIVVDWIVSGWVWGSERETQAKTRHGDTHTYSR